MKYKVGDVVDYLLKYNGKIQRSYGEIVAINKSLFFFKKPKYIVETSVTYTYLDNSKAEYADYFNVKESKIIRKIDQRLWNQYILK